MVSESESKAPLSWLQGPELHNINEPFSEGSQFRVSFYWNPKNLESSLRNLTKAVTLLRLEVSRFNEISDQKVSAQKIEALDNVLTTLWAELGPSARYAIVQHVDGTWPTEPPQSSGDLLADFLDQADQDLDT